MAIQFGWLSVGIPDIADLSVPGLRGPSGRRHPYSLWVSELQQKNIRLHVQWILLEAVQISMTVLVSCLCLFFILSSMLTGQGIWELLRGSDWSPLVFKINMNSECTLFVHIFLVLCTINQCTSFQRKILVFVIFYQNVIILSAS